MNHGVMIQDSVKPPSLQRALGDRIVRQRIVEYLGGDTLENATCRYLGRLNPTDPSRFDRHPPRDLTDLLDQSCELARSLEDRVSMLIHLDIEYVNFDDPAAAFVDPRRTFRLQEPLVREIESCLLALGIRYLHLVTGQGHHFVWQIHKDSPVARQLAELGVCTSPDGGPIGNPVFSHLALLMEFLAHRIKSAAAPLCEIPVEITAQHVGVGRFGMREMLSIDTSEYGDPLSSRMIRIPYTVYRKPWISGLIDRLGIAGSVPEFFALPLHEMDVMTLIDHRHLPETTLDLAHRAGVGIPFEEEGTGRLLEAYLGSGLAGFHREFYSVDHGDPVVLNRPLEEIAGILTPPCLEWVLENPNDWLLKPSGMQLVTRCLLAAGWHPRHIAGLVCSRFRDPVHEWGIQWEQYDPAMRAEFYVRLFAGQIDQSVDGGVDFNCRSQQEKQFCWNPHECSLEPIAGRIYRTNNQPSTQP